MIDKLIRERLKRYRRPAKYSNIGRKIPNHSLLQPRPIRKIEQATPSSNRPFNPIDRNWQCVIRLSHVAPPPRRPQLRRVFPQWLHRPSLNDAALEHMAKILSRNLEFPHRHGYKPPAHTYAFSRLNSARRISRARVDAYAPEPPFANPCAKAQRTFSFSDNRSFFPIIDHFETPTPGEFLRPDARQTMEISR